ncbi:kelch-like protein 25 [Pecten maximus]|uniref:kelch-like protein 25 n=1 Tax=Pecten maximus TaxID=6579 RepID=UPI001457FD46|nr:kelch-like protein 25 [Pecten maximus]
MALSDYSTDLTSGLNRLRLDGKYSDVTIRCGDRTYSCHRVVLAAMSEFFECMFDSPMEESMTSEVDLTAWNISKDVDICEKVLQFIYTGESAIDMSSAVHLLDSAAHFQMASLKAACLKFLSINLNKTNCLAVWQTASIHGFGELEALALSLVKKHFPEICYSEDFLALNRKEYILNILNGQNVNCPDTTVICRAVMLWINADFDNRVDYIDEIMNALNTLPMDVRDIEAIVVREQFGDIHKHSAYQRAVQSMKDQRVFRCNSVAKHVTFSDESIVVIGGSEDETNRDVQCFSFPQKKWFTLTALPFDVGFDFAVCSGGVHIYVTGGTTRKTAFLRYDGERNVWENMPEMPNKRQRHCMAIVRNNLYVFGGYDTPQSSPYRTIDIFDLTTFKWKTSGNHILAIPVRSASCVVLGQTIYVVGGLDLKGNQVNRVQYFDAKDNLSGAEYQVLPVEPNIQYKAVVVENTLYIVCKNGDVLRYDPGANKRPPVNGRITNFPRKDYGICEFEGNILVLGGTVKFQTKGDMIQFNIEKSLTVSMQEAMPAPKRQFGLCKATVMRRHLSNIDN